MPKNEWFFPVDLQLFAEDEPNPTPDPNEKPGSQKGGDPNPENKTEPNAEKKYSEEELNRAKQSASSTGKNEILKELGISSIEEGKKLIGGKSDLEKQVADLTSKWEKSEKERAGEHETAVLNSLGLDPKHIEDARILAKARIDDKTGFDEAAKKVVSDNPSFLLAGRPVKFGPQEQKGSAPKSGSGMSEGLVDKYPWLK